MKIYLTPPKNLLLLILLFLFTLSACSSNEETNNSSDQDTDISVQTDANTPQDTSPPEAMLSIKNSDGEHFLCENPYPETILNKYKCVHANTKSPYSCVPMDDDLDGFFRCTSTEESPWTPPCDDFKQFGDNKSGRSCWAPPQDYCKDGCSTAVTWYCKDDASTCCQSGCDCFGCDWVQVSMDDEKPLCQIAGNNTPESTEFCETFFAKLPTNFQSCIQGECDQETITQMANNQACKTNTPNPNLLICDK